MIDGLEEHSVPAEPCASDVWHTLTFSSAHLRLIQVSLRDVTDCHNELVHEREWLLHPREELRLKGNLFVVEDLIRKTGTILIRKSPLPGARAVAGGDDLRVNKGPEAGFELHLVKTGDCREDPWVVLEYTGDWTERTRTLHAWQNAQRPATLPHACPRFLSNTWGDRSRDARLRHAFVEAEIDAAARLGVDVVQLDDGWQKGTSSNSAYAGKAGGIWSGFWDADPEFWTPHPERFPEGLAPLVERARAHGMNIGLWFVPDRCDDYANWHRDAEAILGLHQAHGVEHFKIDGVRAESAVAFANLERLFAAVLTGSRGYVVMDLDITAGVRPGYFGAVGIGPLYVENRYTDWHGYWPHMTLRNLWKLSRWIDPRRLRFEFLNNLRNADKYPDDPLAPSRYPPATLFATVMFANPLGWFEVSNLPDAWIEAVAPLVKIWRAHRDELFAGNILPVGAIPDGIEPTGFVSRAADLRSGYALIFREMHPDPNVAIPVPGMTPEDQWELLAGDGGMASDTGTIRATVNNPLGFVFGRFIKPAGNDS